MRHINRYPRQGMRLTLMLLPFVLLVAAWISCCPACRR